MHVHTIFLQLNSYQYFWIVKALDLQNTVDELGDPLTLMGRKIYTIDLLEVEFPG